MDCLAESLVLGFVDGGLTVDEARAVETHLAVCADCRRLVSVLAQSDAVADASEADADGKAGVIIAERYRLAHKVGAGGMSEVWAAQHLVTRKKFALKFLKSDAQLDRKRLYREARAASLVNHPNVLEVRDVLELEDGTPVLVMDLLLGCSLRTHLENHAPLSVEETAKIMAPVVSAVGAAHAMGIVHRDLKPDNVFLSETGADTPTVKVLDFGIAKLTAIDGDAERTAALTRSGEMMGTPYYMSPEQAFGEPDVDHRSDLWAIGVMLYECLVGSRPFIGTNLGQVWKHVTSGDHRPLVEARPDVSTDIAELVASLLSVEKAKRPTDLRPVRALLQRYADVAVSSFGPAAQVSAPSAKGWVRRSMGGVAVALVLTALGVIFTLHDFSPSPETRPIAIATPAIVAPRPVDAATAPSPPPRATPSETRATPKALRQMQKPTTPPVEPTPTPRLPGGVTEEVPF